METIQFLAALHQLVVAAAAASAILYKMVFQVDLAAARVLLHRHRMLQVLVEQVRLVKVMTAGLQLLRVLRLAAAAAARGRLAARLQPTLAVTVGQEVRRQLVDLRLLTRLAVAVAAQQQKVLALQALAETELLGLPAAIW